MKERDALPAIYQSDPVRRRTAKRYTIGEVSDVVTAGMVSVRVGATLPDGSAVSMSVPAALGFTPAVGQAVGIIYPNDSVHAAYAAGIGDAAASPPGVGSHSILDHTDAATYINQPVLTGSSPTFVGATFSGLTASILVGTNASKALTSIAIGTSLSLAAGTLNTIQGIRTADSPSFTNLTLTGTTGLTGGPTSAAFFIKPAYTGNSWSIGAITIQPVSGTPPVILQVLSQGGSNLIELDQYGAFRFTGRFTFNSQTAAKFYHYYATGKASANWQIGTPMYRSSATQFALAKADAAATSDAVGLQCTAGASTVADPCPYGYLYDITGNWDILSGGSGGLTAGATYYLSPSTAGKITSTRPTTAGQFVKKVGIAISTTVMLVDCFGPTIAL